VFPDRDRRAILDAIAGLSTKDHREGFFRNLEHQVSVSRIAIDQERAAPTKTQMRAALEATGRAVRDLRWVLTNLDSESRRLIQDALRQQLADKDVADDVFLSLEMQTDRLLDAVPIGLKKVSALSPTRRGPRESYWLRFFEDYVAYSFQTDLGVRPTKSRHGPFATVLAICLRHLGPSLRKNPTRKRSRASARRVFAAVDRTR